MSVADNPSVRSYTSAQYERGRGPLIYHLDRSDQYRDHTSGTGSRMSSRRDHTPGSPHYRVSPSTPISKISSRTSLSESDRETAETQSTVEEDDHYGRGSVKASPRAEVEPRRRRRHRKHRGESVHVVPLEEDAEPEELEELAEPEPAADLPVPEPEIVGPESEPEERGPKPPVEPVSELEEAAAAEPESEADVEKEKPSHSHTDKATHSRTRPKRPRFPVTQHPPSHSPRLVVEEVPIRKSTRRTSRKSNSEENVGYDRPSHRKSHDPNSSRHHHRHLSVTTPPKRRSIVERILFRPGRIPEKTRTAKQVECLACLEEIPSSKTAKLKCGHRMCDSCLKELFRLSTRDPQHMPPACCKQHIPIKYAEGLFDIKFKKKWNQKFLEYSQRNRLFCPTRRCGQWIKPEYISRDPSSGRKIGKCGSCKTRVCGSCNNKWHSSRNCPSDEATNQILEQARRQGWQQCFCCRNMVELKEGCNHMTCRCGAQFCMICGDKWKTCDCPLFSYDTIETDHLEMHPHSPLALRARRYPSPTPHRHYRYDEPTPEPTLRPPPVNLEEEQRLRDLLEQREQRHLARRLRPLGADEESASDDGSDSLEHSHTSGSKRYPAPSADQYRRGRGILPPPPPNGPSPFDRSARPGFGSDIAKRIHRESSQERRLADRFSSKRSHYSSPVIPTLSPQLMMPMGLSPMGPAAPMMPLSPYRTIMTGPPPLMRRHTVEEALYNGARTTRPSERIIPSRIRRDYAAEAAVHAPRRSHSKATSSSMAGLSGPGSGMHRVYEWRDHVEPGVPDGEAEQAKPSP